MNRGSWVSFSMLLAISWTCLPFVLSAEELPASWRLAESRVEAGAALTVFVESEKTSGRPAFKIETVFDAPPALAALTLMHDMLDDSDLPDGQRREILESGEREALVYTFIDLPFMLSDRELAIRIVHSEDAETGVHRIDWNEANEFLPVDEADVVRLEGARGYWEFRPGADDETHATYLTQTEIGGSIPDSIGDVLMKGQAIDAVTRLREKIQKRRALATSTKSTESSDLPSVSLGR